MKKIKLKGMGFYAPEKVLSNQDFEKMVDTSDEWIITRSGIRNRHVVSPEQATSDLALQASIEALKQAGLKAEDLDLIVVGTSSPDMIFPSVGCLIAEQLHAPRPMAFDVSAGCSGFLYSLSVAEQYLRTGKYHNALVLGADCISRFTDYTDRSTCVLFGDGAGALVLANEDQGDDFILDSINGTDPYGSSKLTLPGGGSRKPASAETLVQRDHFIKMNGKDIFKFATRISETLINEILHKNHLSKDDIRWYAFHQANIRIIDSAVDRLGLSKNQVMITLDEYGNTSSASVPMSLYQYAQQGKLNKGDLVLMVVFGAGLTYAASLVRWQL